MTATGPVQVFVDLTRFAATATRAQLRDRVRALEDVGAAGVSVSDHIFFTSAGRPRTEGVGHGADPLTTLAAVAGLSERLAVQTVVMNAAWVHPGLLLRAFAQLAVLLGGDRITAGLGAGWSTEEFDALGLAMPGFGTRMDRLAEVLAVARDLWTDGSVSHGRGPGFRTGRWTAAPTCCSAAPPGWPRRWPSGARPTGSSASRSARKAGSPPPRTIRCGSAARCSRCWAEFRTFSSRAVK